MERKLTFLSLALIALLGIGAYFWFFGRTAIPKTNPLKNVDLDKASRLVIENRFGKIRFDKQPNGWQMIEPSQDIPDASGPLEILGSLKRFSLGSIISENPKRYSEFQVDSQQATKIQVFVTGQDKPVLSGFVGKSNGQPDGAYFRLDESSGPVYLATGLSPYDLQRDPNAFRQKIILDFPPGDPTRLRLTYGKQHWDLARSSNTWTSADGKHVDPSAVQTLIFGLRDFKADSFASGAEPTVDLGLNPPATPFLEVSVEFGGKPQVLTVGKAIAAPFPKALPMRYARSNTRSAIFIVQENSVKIIADWFSKAAK